MIRYIADKEHYDIVLKSCFDAKSSIWIATADIKDLHVKYKSHFVPFLKLLSDKISDSVSIRLIHAKEPGKRFKDDFDKYPNIAKNLERMFCPRVHFKLIIIDQKYAYTGSANLTGAGLGAKSTNRRNFESGIFTDDPEILDNIINQFDNVWIGKFCKSCERKDYCSDRII